MSRSSVLIIGCGGVGCSCSAFLARAGVGRMRLVDADVVSLTDLHRQIHYYEEDTGGLHLKVVIAARRLRACNAEVEIEPIAAEFNPASATELIDGVDLVLDCSDNFATRMLINEVAVKYNLPWIHGACFSTSGMVIPFPDRDKACYRCVVGDAFARFAAQHEPLPILGPVAGVVGCLEAMEAIKLLVDPDPVDQRMIHFDGARNIWETVEVSKHAGCLTCGKGIFEFLCGSATWHSSPRRPDGVIDLDLPESVDFEAVWERLADEADETAKGALVIESEGTRFAIFRDGRVLVTGASDTTQAEEHLKRLLST